LISGPRQVGKTTLSKEVFPKYSYFNYDRLPDQKKMLEEEWDHHAQVIIFDELHKMKKWKQWLTGLYDTETSGNFLCGQQRSAFRLFDLF
jgi:predicted AAA+ superfamily ATPase